MKMSGLGWSKSKGGFVGKCESGSVPGALWSWCWWRGINLGFKTIGHAGIIFKSLFVRMNYKIFGADSPSCREGYEATVSDSPENPPQT
jgi:hypothetical protein